MVLGYGANQAVASPSLASLVNEYAAILASQVQLAHNPPGQWYNLCKDACWYQGYTPEQLMKPPKRKLFSDQIW